VSARPDLRSIGIRARNLKCFEDWQGFESLCPFNLIVGRNNSGKSALLDLVCQAMSGFSDDPHFSRKDRPVEIEHSYAITQRLVNEVFLARPLNAAMPVTPGDAWRHCAGARVVVNKTAGAAEQVAFLRDGQVVAGATSVACAQHIYNCVGPPLKGLLPIRLRADRDILKESSAGANELGEHGENATRLVERYLHDTPDHKLVEQHLVADLNAVMQPDWYFRRIFPKRVGGSNGQWELNLEDAQGRLVPLSHTGSGVKTVLLVLILLHLAPHAKGHTDLSKFVFCLEELENNLHPAAQRRLFLYLRQRAAEDKCTFFITTHSNTVIDLFSRDDQAQVVHVEHDGDKATVRQVTCNLRHGGVLDDLGCRASDLLQANVVVWVEGPSDRLYFNRWVELWSNNELHEGVHYQCVWYGGAMLAGMSFEDQAACDDLVSALKVNRHAIVLMDSDRRAADDPLKERVRRVSEEAETSGGCAWVTAGREVENYIPDDALRLGLNVPSLMAPGLYDDVLEHIGRSGDKPGLARLVVPHISRDMLARTRDLGPQLDRVCQLIRGWNGLPGVNRVEATKPPQTRD
jgi:hypothetical protein